MVIVVVLGYVGLMMIPNISPFQLEGMRFSARAARCAMIREPNK